MRREEREAKHRALHKDGRVVCGEYLIKMEPSYDAPNKRPEHMDRYELNEYTRILYNIYPRNGMPPLGYDRVARCNNFSEALLTVANLEKEES